MPLGSDYRLLWLGQMLTVAGLTVVVPLLPLYMNELGAASITEIGLWTGLSLAAPAIMSIWSAPLWGRCGDRFGRKWMVTRALIGVGASLILMGYAQTPLQFFLCRLLQGALGGVDDAVAAYAGSRGEGRGKALGGLQGATAAGALAGPLLGAILVAEIGFQPLLVIIGTLTLVCGLFSVWVLPTLQTEPIGHSSSVHIKIILHTVNALWNKPRLRAFLIGGIWIQIGIFGLHSAFALHVDNLNGGNISTVMWVGLLQALFWSAVMLSSPWWGQLHDKKGVEKNYLLAASGCGLAILLQALPLDPGWFTPLRFFQGFCYAALFPAILLVVANASTDDNRGLNLGLTSSLLVLGQIAGSLLGGWLVSQFSAGTVIAMMSIAHLLGAAWILPHLNQTPIGHRQGEEHAHGKIG